MAGLVLSFRECKKTKVLAVVFLLYGLTLVFFFTNIRIRLPLLVILIPMAVYGIQKVICSQRKGEKRRVMLYCASFALFTVVESLPIPGIGDRTAHLNTHANILARKGKIVEAQQYREESSLLEGAYSAYANLALANLHMKKREYPRALHYLETIDDESFAGADKYSLKGDLLLRMRNRDGAIKAYRNALEINFGRNEIRTKLIRELKRKNMGLAREEIEKQHFVKSFFSLKTKRSGREM